MSEENPEKRIKWDEEVIQEHNKERGTRQKIDEPPTPYNYLQDEEENEISHPAEAPQAVSQNWEALNAKLFYESEKQRIEEEDRQKRITIGEQQYDDEPHEEKKENNFASKRASHYNEYLVLKAMKNAHKSDEEEDDEL